MADCDKRIDQEGGVRWDHGDHHDSSDFWEILYLFEYVPTVFLSLIKLLLSYITFEIVSVSLAGPFNVANIWALTIRHWRCASDFLESLTMVEGGLKLRSFELCIDDGPSWDFKERPIQEFLESFGGLQELCLVVNVGGVFSSYLDAISRHSDSLQRLV